MSINVSTLAFKSNLYPVEKSFYDDATFRSKIHDPFSLQKLKEEYSLTSIQANEYGYASVHCTYALKDDYPWGTIKDKDGNERVVCKCINTECHLFGKCRPDFNKDELNVNAENQSLQIAILEVESRKLDSNKEKGNAKAAIMLFDEEKEEPVYTQEQHKEDNQQPENKIEIKNPIPQFIEPVEQKKVDFTSFIEVEQDVVISLNHVERTVVNAGPGTGKTWTLIEKIIYMINEGEVEAENILVLCFSRSAVEVIKNRLSDAAESGRLGYEWKNVDIRTFDSFATYLLAWVQDNINGLLPQGFVLEANDYDQRIIQAVNVFKNQENLLESYEHIIVDEVQDLVGNRAELVIEILKSLPETCGFTILGDSCQALYDYMAQGDPFVMSSIQFYENIFNEFPNNNYYYFTENHRQKDSFAQLTIPYRNAILTGTPENRVSVASELLNDIDSLAIKLSSFGQEEATKYTKNNKTLGILTRTNGQALQISAWLRNQDVQHSLNRGLGSPVLGDWIAKILYDYDNDTIDKNTFVAKCCALESIFSYEIANECWMALVSTQFDETRQRYEVSDLLKGLLRNSKEPLLYESLGKHKNNIIVSNIHRAKGKEFDHVIVLDDVIKGVACLDTEDVLEHKVCYVALTRPRHNIEKVEILDKDKYIYITMNEDLTKRCSKAGVKTRKSKKAYISHFEVGSELDLDMKSFAENDERQNLIRENLSVGTRLKLLKCAEGTKQYVVYRIVLEDNEKMILGYTSKSFSRELEKAMQHIWDDSKQPVTHQYYPNAFCDVYVHNKITCVSGITPYPEGAKVFGDTCIWTGITITGFAAVDKDTY